MNFVTDEFKEEDYLLKNFKNYKTLLNNNTNRVANLKMEFVDYKANQKLPCFVYHKMSIQCLNKHGISREIFSDKTCMDMMQWFSQCVENHKSFAKLKKYFPEEFINNNDYNLSDNYEDLFN